MKKSIAIRAVVGVVLGLTALASKTASAQYGANTVVTRKQCLADKDLDIIRQIKSLKRFTTNDDPVMPFNPDFFLGVWTQHWVNSEVPWSSAGPNDGTVTFKYVENCYYQGQVKSVGPDGPYTVDIEMMYHAGRNFLTWIEHDSRGFTMIREGDIAGHGPTSQQFDYRFELVPFTFKGKLIRGTGTIFLTGPTRARQDVVLSIDGFTQRLGAPTLDRPIPPPPK